MFLANYSDGVTYMPLPSPIEFSKHHDKGATFVSAKPNLTYQVVSADADGLVSEVKPIRDTELRSNCGYFVFKREIFQNMRNCEELVHEPFDRLMTQKQLIA